MLAQKEHLKGDISRRGFWLGVSILVLVRLVLISQQMVYTWVDGAPLDDELMFHWAQNISAGQWLGPYDELTLSKRPLFAVWLALLNRLHIPYLIGGQWLWCLAALAAVMAVAPVVVKYRSRLLLFAFLCWNPASVASFTLRVYRDNIFPALCLAFFAGVTGWALRCTDRLRRSLGWLILAGFGLTGAWLCREDGVWVLPFALIGLGAGVVRVLTAKGLTKKAVRSLCAVLPYGMLCAGVAAVCAVNQQFYGVFTLSDFSSGSFADAMGAMTRVQESEPVPLVSVPTSVRKMLYEKVPQLGCLEYWLEEDDDLQNSFRNPVLDDYQSGSFYWALRRAAKQEGIYDSAATADAYWSAVAAEINRLCDEGVLPSEGGKRSGTTPPVKAENLLPTLAESVKSLGYTLTFMDCAPAMESRTIGTTEDLAVWEGYLHTRTNVAAAAGTDLPYYNILQKAVYAVLNGVRYVYAVLLPLTFAAGLWRWVRLGCRAAARKHAPQEQTSPGFLWLILLGLLAMAALRVGMISFMEVASFHIGTYVMYLSTVHPLLLWFSGVCCLAPMMNRSAQ